MCRHRSRAPVLVPRSVDVAEHYSKALPNRQEYGSSFLARDHGAEPDRPKRDLYSPYLFYCLCLHHICPQLSTYSKVDQYLHQTQISVYIPSALSRTLIFS